MLLRKISPEKSLQKNRSIFGLTNQSCDRRYTLSNSMNLVPKFFSKTFITFYSTLQVRGEANDQKHADPGKKNRNSRKSREYSRNLSEAFLRSRKEENLYGRCDMINARRILSKGSTLLKGCWFWSKKLHCQKNFGRKFTVYGLCAYFQKNTALNYWSVDQKFELFELAIFCV